MAEMKQALPLSETPEPAVRTAPFWEQYQKPILIGLGALAALVGGYFAYNSFVREPKMAKAEEAIFKAEEYFRLDSLNLALNGDRTNPGLERVITQYGGTPAGNRARFMAGSILLRNGAFAKAEGYLEEFETASRPVQAQAYSLLGSAYAEQGKNNEALEAYKKAAHHFEEDQQASAEYLFRAAYFADRVMNRKEEAVELYRELKKKYPATRPGFEADKYLAQAGATD